MSIAHLIGREELMAYLDGEIAPPRAAIVRAHVEGCGECAVAIEDSSALSRALLEWRVEPAPDTLVAPIAEVAPGLPSPGPSGTAAFAARKTWLVSLWMAAAVIFLTTFYWGFPRRFAWQDPVSKLADREQYQLVAPAAQSLKDQPASDSLALPNYEVSARALPAPAPSAPPPPSQPALNDTPMVVRTATLGLSTDRFDEVLRRMGEVASHEGGALSAYQVSGSAASGRAISATVRVPVASMDAAMAGLRALGTVTEESQATEEITDAHRDLTIRIENAKREAARLNDLLTRQSDRLSDVLEVEQAQARVQTEIEQMAAQETAMRGRAALSTIQVSVKELRHAQLALGPQPIGTRLRNALVDGLRGAADSALWALLAFMAVGPGLLVWFVLLALPAVLVWWVARRIRAHQGLR